jgi:predicted TIM-barrel fold metal-dependent hydrolase
LKEVSFLQQVFDAHFHIINPEYPLIENNGYLPPEYTVASYIARISHLNVSSGALVSGSFQGFDQTYLLNSLALLNQSGHRFVGVTQIPADVSDDRIISLDQQGVRAVRFNLKRGGSESVRRLEYMAQRVFELVGWHVELYAGAESLSALESVVSGLPAVSIDHLGLESASLPLLERLIGLGVKVKVCGFGRVDFEPLPVIAALYKINPEALMFGTDLPSTRAPVPFQDNDLYSMANTFDEQVLNDIFWLNARRFYKFDDNII